MSASLHHKVQKDRHAHAHRVTRRAGYAHGGHVKDEAAKDVHKHEEHLHKGKPKTKLKVGGKVKGEKPAHRLDKKARGGAEVYKDEPRAAVLHDKEKYVNVDKEEAPKKRAAGGRAGHKGGKTNIIIHAGGEGMPGTGGAGAAPNPQAMQQAEQAGMKKGAMMVIQKLKQGAGGAGGPPPGGPPGMGAPPPGGMPPGAPPGGAPGGAPMMRSRGGPAEEREEEEKHDDKGEEDKGAMIQVRAHERKRGGRTMGGEC